MGLQCGLPLRMQLARPPHRGGRSILRLAEQFGELFGDGAAEFFRIDDGDGAALMARDVVAAADGRQLDGGFFLYVRDHLAEMLFQIITGIHRER